jgi:hypothetical protein
MGRKEISSGKAIATEGNRSGADLRIRRTWRAGGQNEARGRIAVMRQSSLRRSLSAYT